VFLLIGVIEWTPAVEARKVADDSYYRLLGVSPEASETELRKAYHKLALKWHPDKHRQKSEAEQKQAEEKFKELSVAYDTLSDPDKRRKYDNAGGKGQNVDPFKDFDPFKGFDASKVFDEVDKMFQEFAGGFKFSFNFGGSGGRQAKGLFAGEAEHVQTLTDNSKLKPLMAGAKQTNASKQFLAVLCIPSNQDCKGAVAPVAKAAKSYKGVVSFYAIDCMAQPQLCREIEPNVQVYPCLVYYGYNRRLPYGHFEDGSKQASSTKFTNHGLRTWLAKVVPEKVLQLRTVADCERFFAESRHPRVVVLVDKPGTPLRLKSLSIDFQDSVTIGLASRQGSAEAFAAVLDRMGIPTSEASLKLPAVVDVQARSVADAPSDLGTYLTAVAEQALVPKLSLESYRTGLCSTNDRRYCLLAIVPGEESAKRPLRKALQAVDSAFHKEPKDVLQVVYVSEEDAEMLAKLANLLEGAGCRSGTVAGECCKVFLWRPLWCRLEPFCGSVGDSEELLTFARSGLFKAAVDGSDGLSHEHSEL